MVSFLLFSSLALSSVAATTPSSWELVGPSPGDTPLTFHLGLRLDPADLRALERAVLAASTPGAPAYGRHLARAAADDLVRPPPAATAEVLAWLASAGCALSTTAAQGGDWITAHGTCACAEALLRAPCAM